MVNTVKLQFTAKPGLYPPHKGGRTWLHEQASVKQVPHEQAPDKVTTKIFPKVVLQTGDTIDVDAETAKTYVSRYKCFEVVGAKPSSKPTKTGDA